MTACRWPRKLTKAKLRKRRIFNVAELAKGAPIIAYEPGEWVVWRFGARAEEREILNLFRVHGRASKEPTLREVLVWARKHLGVREWVRTPFGSYVPRDVAERVVREAGKP